MELFAKIINGSQPLTILQKAQFHTFERILSDPLVLEKIFIQSQGKYILQYLHTSI